MILQFGRSTTPYRSYHIGVCESMQLIGPYKEVQDATLKDAAVQIKEHFGVDNETN